jgi:hypothetical protein
LSSATGSSGSSTGNLFKGKKLLNPASPLFSTGFSSSTNLSEEKVGSTPVGSSGSVSGSYSKRKSVSCPHSKRKRFLTPIGSSGSSFRPKPSNVGTQVRSSTSKSSNVGSDSKSRHLPIFQAKKQEFGSTLEIFKALDKV